MKFNELLELLKTTDLEYKVYDNYDKHDHYVFINHGQVTFYIDNDEISMSYCDCTRKDTKLLIETIRKLSGRSRHIQKLRDEDNPYTTMPKRVPKCYDYKKTVKHHLLEYYFLSKQLKRIDLYSNVPESHLIEIDRNVHTKMPTFQLLHAHTLSKKFNSLKEKLKDKNYVNDLLSKIPKEIYKLKIKES